ncbi:MAG: phosphoribosyltransferase family protein [Patescibacteria group bacterium]
MNEAIEILKKSGAMLENSHFVGTSGLHFDTYINKDALYPHTQYASEMGKLFAEKYKDADVEIVVAPALGGIILSQWTAYHLTKLTGKEVLGIYTEKDAEKNQVFTRGYDEYVKGKKVLIIEDIVTTGGSVLKTINAVKQNDGIIVGVCVMVNKNPTVVNKKMLGDTFDSLSEYEITMYTAEECPLCKNGVPINIKVGHGKKFLEKNI